MNVSFVIPTNNMDTYLDLVGTLQFPEPGHQIIPKPNYPSAAKALNEGIGEAVNDIIVCCHHDVRFPEKWIQSLVYQITAINDPNFGVLGTFGVDFEGNWAGNIRDPHNNPRYGRLPCPAQSLDEHCLIIRKSSDLRFDESLGGWHFYGADICLEARRQGMACYAIDAWLEHLSGGRIDEGFKNIAGRFEDKWTAIKDRPCNVIKTTCGIFTFNYEADKTALKNDSPLPGA